jgi:ABC-type multidrug transport system ATPase subunit
MLELRNVSKAFRDLKAVDDVSLTLGSGVVGLVGHNGAGKTTLMQLLATLTRPTAGSILFDGQDIVRKPDAMRRRLGFLPQEFRT